MEVARSIRFVAALVVWVSWLRLGGCLGTLMCMVMPEDYVTCMISTFSFVLIPYHSLPIPIPVTHLEFGVGHSLHVFLLCFEDLHSLDVTIGRGVLQLIKRCIYVKM